MDRKHLRRSSAARGGSYGTEVNVGHFFGYVEDDMTPEDIERMFSTVSEYQRDKADDGAGIGGLLGDEPTEPAEELTLEEQEELFKKLSGHLVADITRSKYEQMNYELLLSTATDADWDDPQFCKQLFGAAKGNGDGDEADDSDFFDTSDEDWSDFENEGRRKRSRGPRSAGSRRSQPKKVRSALIDLSGEYTFIMKRNKQRPDPRACERVRLPAFPVPRSHGKTIRVYAPELEEELPTTVGGSTVYSGNAFNAEKVCCKGGQAYNAILVDAPWKHVDAEQVFNMKFSDRILPRGYVFVWAEKEYIARVFQWMEGQGFIYCDNLCWVKQNVNNEFAMQPSQFFQRSKLTLYIFRKNNAETRKMQLRHQRTCDVVFDYVREEAADEHIEDKPFDFVYNMIETMLPDANYTESDDRGLFLELFARPYHARKGWTHVVHEW